MFKDVSSLKMVLGNKCDLLGSIKTNDKKCKAMAKNYKCLFNKASALKNINVTESIEELAYKIFCEIGNKPTEKKSNTKGKLMSVTPNRLSDLSRSQLSNLSKST